LKAAVVVVVTVLRPVDGVFSAFVTVVAVADALPILPRSM
jgi:hypothetical protein